jgi:hypothetical protein
MSLDDYFMLPYFRDPFREMMDELGDSFRNSHTRWQSAESLKDRSTIFTGWCNRTVNMISEKIPSLDDKVELF